MYIYICMCVNSGIYKDLGFPDSNSMVGLPKDPAKDVKLLLVEKNDGFPTCLFPDRSSSLYLKRQPKQYIDPLVSVHFRNSPEVSQLSHCHFSVG